VWSTPDFNQVFPSGISLAEQLKRISDVAPVGKSCRLLGHFFLNQFHITPDLDPEDAHLINPDDQLNVNAAARDHYIDSGWVSLISSYM
jgi:hypothetical protein